MMLWMRITATGRSLQARSSGSDCHHDVSVSSALVGSCSPRSRFTPLHPMRPERFLVLVGGTSERENKAGLIGLALSKL